MIYFQKKNKKTLSMSKESVVRIEILTVCEYRSPRTRIRGPVALTT